MTPVDQQSLYDPKTGQGGDCWRACIASILELPLDQVPDFLAEHGHAYLHQTNVWLKERGLWFIDVRDLGGYPGYVIASGPSPRDKAVFHCVVWTGDGDGGGMVHDPHPSRAGLWGPPYEYSIILPISLRRPVTATASARPDKSACRFSGRSP